MKVIVAGQDPKLFAPVADALADDGIAVTSFADVPSALAAPAAQLAGAAVLLAPGFAQVGEAQMDQLPALRGIVSPFTGIEGFDRAAANSRGILIANGQIDENVESMAEATVLMLLAATYRLPDAMAAMADGGWPRAQARGRMLKAMQVGLVGFGRIAQAVTERLRPFGCRIVVFAPRLHAPLPDDVRALPLDKLVATSDAVLLLASLGPDSRHLLDRGLIARLKPDAIVVNTARGGLVDEPALATAALAGRIGCLALDVFEREPLPADAPIRTVPGAILTPHTIGHTRETIACLPLHALDNIRRLLRGEPPPSLANPEALPAWLARIGTAA